MKKAIAALLTFGLCGCSLFGPTKEGIYVGIFDAVQGEHRHDSIVISSSGTFLYMYREDETREGEMISGGTWRAVGSRVWLNFTMVGDGPSRCVFQVKEEGDVILLQLVSEPKQARMVRATRFSKKKKGSAQPGATDNPDDAQRLREDH